MQRFADQFAPFVAAGLTGVAGASVTDAAGTVIRLPLRTAAAASRASALVPCAADDAEDTRTMLATFAANAHRILLFSASLGQIRVAVRNAPDTRGEGAKEKVGDRCDDNVSTGIDGFEAKISYQSYTENPESLNSETLKP